MIHIVTNGIYRFCEWVTRLAYLNLLWITFSLAGLVVLGFMPSTVAMFTVARKWLNDDPDVPVFKTFLEVFKKEFIKANLLGLILFGLAALFYLDFRIFGLMDGETTIMMGIFSSLLVVFGILVLFIFPVYVHYDISMLSTFKYALLIGFSRPLHAIGMVAGALGVTYLVFLHITIFIFFSGSLFSFCITALAVKAFKSIETSKGKQQTV